MSTESIDKLMSTFFNEVDMLLALFDKDLNLIDINEAGAKMFRFKRKDIIGKNLADISPDNKSSGRFDAYKEVIRTGKTYEIDEMKPHPSLGNLHFRIKAFKVGDGFALMSKDITDLKETIEELETFIYKSSHDMRAPITTILGLLNLVDTSVEDIAEVKEYNEKVRQQAEHLDSILRILFETTRIKQGTKTIQLIDFNKLVDDVLVSLKLMDGFHQIKFETEINIVKPFSNDKMLIISLFQNLIDNAIKYKKEGSDKARIIISVAEERTGVKITISDNGIGIPKRFQADVFKMFFRATNQASGSGLGLYTVSHTVKRLSGQIYLESKEGVGTKFTIHLPNEKI